MKTLSLLLIILLLISFAGSMIQAGVAATPTLSNSGGGSWNYYREITLNSGNSLTDYQMLITLDGNNFPEKAFSDGSDIRFTDVSNMELDYWIESYDYSAKSARIWVKVPSIPASSDTKILMYYGNDKASSSSNGDATFMFFDDFDGSEINTDKWQIIGSHEMHVGHSLLYVGVGDVDSTPALVSRRNFDDNVVIEMKIKSRNDADPHIFARTSLIEGAWTSPGYVFIEEPDETSRDGGFPAIRVNTAGYSLITDPTFDASPDLFWWYSAFLDGNNLGFRIYDTNRNKKVDISVIDTNYSTGALGIGKDPREWEHSSAWIDVFLIRKYRPSEPAISIGSENLMQSPLPSPPQILRTTAGDLYVNLDWNAPGDDSGAAIINHNIYRGTAPEGERLLTTVGNVLTYTDSDVTNDQTYYYQVSAVNAVGEGEKSEEASATPKSDVTTPSAPRNLQATPGEGYVGLKWDKPSVDGSAAITNYMIYRGTTYGGETLLTTVGNMLTYTDKDVTNDQTYYYHVSAVNSAGEGAMSEGVKATPISEVSAVNSAGTGEKSEEVPTKAPPFKSDPLSISLIAALITAAAVIIAAIINRRPIIAAIIDHPSSKKSTSKSLEKKQQYGSVSATSSPDGARVFLDGVDKGESPVTLDKIRKGTHIVLFSKSGYSDCEKRVVVNADQITPVHCDLKKPEMKLRLSAEPPEIPADGKSKSVITISVEDENGITAPVPESTEIVLETNIGLIDTPVRIPAGGVSATSILTSSTAGGTATVRAKSESGLESSVAVRFA